MRGHGRHSLVIIVAGEGVFVMEDRHECAICSPVATERSEGGRATEWTLPPEAGR